MKENLELLRSRTTRMEALMDCLLDYARVDRERDKFEAFSAQSALDNVLLLLGPEAKRAVRVASDMPHLFTTRSVFEQVLFNLVSNALQHSARDDVSITISAERREKDYEFSVRDNGLGIDPRFHERIFEVFQTLESRDEKESVGMGLALVKKVVEGRGGRVRLESQPGQGAVFKFTWPLDSPAGEA
jgi:signal transduction histidine kinase